MTLNVNLFCPVSDTYTTAQSYVFIQQDGERSIIMASGATSIIKKQTVEEFFGMSLAFVSHFYLKCLNVYILLDIHGRKTIFAITI